VATPLPPPGGERLGPPDPAEVQVLASGVTTAIAPPSGLTQLQAVLVDAMFDAMTGHAPQHPIEPTTPAALAATLADRNAAFRTRIVQVMLLGALVLRPLPREVADRLEAFAAELSVGDGMLDVARRYADGAFDLAAFDFDRNGYTASWSAERQRALHSSRVLDEPWAATVDDPELAARWRSLEDLPADTLGRRVTDLYRARGFSYPGTEGSAPPLLAQHDWVHVVADYGTTVTSELEVFGFIARANDDPRAFSLLAMVVSLFETGYLRTGAGLFEAFPGQLSREGVAVRIADAMRRGALVEGSIDFLGIDWFELANLPVEEVRSGFHVVPKARGAVAAGSVGPWEPGGISAFQHEQGRAAAAAQGRPYDASGAAVASEES
jgi:hypothetical protein